MTGPLLKLEHLEVRYGDLIGVSDVSLEVPAGSVVALLGSNGGGKTTTLNAIAGLIPVHSGTISFNGEEVQISSPADARALGIATVYQDLALCDNLDVVANLWLGRELVTSGGLDEVEMEQRTWTLLRELSAKIPSVRIPVAGLSGGQRQTVAIARSLIGDPRVVILDEPTAALGVAQTAEVLNLIERLRERGHGVILISHNMADVLAVADRVVVLRLGRNNGVFNAVEVTSETLVAAITGASGGARRAAAAPPPPPEAKITRLPSARPRRIDPPSAGGR